MAEVGAIASIVGLVATGAKLSIFLFEVSNTLGSAGTEIQQIAIEISLFCSVLKQLRNTLSKAKGCRYSLSALETTSEILTRCNEIFDELENLLAGFKGKGKDGDVDWKARLKWAFKKGDIKVLRTTLESCKITLHLMLTTMDFAQRIASRRMSTIETEKEDEEEGAITQCLLIARQSTVNKLEKLEEEQAIESLTVEAQLTPPAGRRADRLAPRPQVWHRQSRSFDGGRPSVFDLVQDGSKKDKRASSWLNHLVFDTRPLPAGFRRQTWGDTQSTTFLAQQHYQLLHKWTVQEEKESTILDSKVVSTRRETSVEKEVEQVLEVDRWAEKEVEELLDVDKESQTERDSSHHEKLKEKSKPTESNAEPDSPTLKGLTRGPSLYERRTNNQIPYWMNGQIIDRPPPLKRTGGGRPNKTRLTRTKAKHGFSEGRAKVPPPTLEASDLPPTGSKSPSGLSDLYKSKLAFSEGRDKVPPPTLEAPDLLKSGSKSPSGLSDIYKSFKVALDDPTSRVLPAALRKYNIDAPPENYALFITHGEHELECKSGDLPLLIFKELDKKGLKPMFMLRKITTVADPSWERARDAALTELKRGGKSAGSSEKVGFHERVDELDSPESEQISADPSWTLSGQKKDQAGGQSKELDTSSTEQMDAELAGESNLKNIYGIDDLSKFLVSHGRSRKEYVHT